MKKEIRILSKCFFVCLVSITIIILTISLLLHTDFLAEQRAFLYRLLMIDAICCVLCITVYTCIYLCKKQVFGLPFSTSILCVGISTLFIALFLSLGPMPIERSYTIYSLVDMYEHADTIYSAEDIKKQFIEGYVEGANESQKRIDEQVYIGNLQEVSGGYQITDKGKRLVEMFRLVETIFPVPDKNSIYPNGK